MRTSITDMRARSRVLAGHDHDPIRLPALALVIRERLLPACRRRGDLAPVAPDLDRGPAQHVVALEASASVGESALDRRVEVSGPPGRRPPDAPQSSLRVVQAQRHPFVRPPVGERVRLEAVDVAEPIEDRTRLPGRLELHPLRARPVEDVDELAVVDTPPSEPEVEVVPAVGCDLRLLHVYLLAVADILD